MNLNFVSIFWRWLKCTKYTWSAECAKTFDIFTIFLLDYGVSRYSKRANHQITLWNTTLPAHFLISINSSGARRRCLFVSRLRVWLKRIIFDVEEPSRETKCRNYNTRINCNVREKCVCKCICIIPSKNTKWKY